jgi:hypothetical protein
MGQSCGGDGCTLVLGSSRTGGTRRDSLKLRVKLRAFPSYLAKKRHLMRFPSAEMENAEGIAKLKIFAISLRQLQFIFHFGT